MQLPIWLIITLVIFGLVILYCNSENFSAVGLRRRPLRYQRRWYEYLYPQTWYYSWWGYPSVYDPKFTRPYYTQPVPVVNSGNNCHKKCLDRYDFVTNDGEYSYKVNKCINDYCY